MLTEKDKTPSSAYVNEYLQHFLKGNATPAIEAEYRITVEDLKARVKYMRKSGLRSLPNLY